MEYNKETENLFSELNSKNIKLYIENGILKYKAPKGAITPVLLKKIKLHKEEIILFLQTAVSEDDKSILCSPIPKVEKREYYPLSAAQKRMFVLNKLDDKSTAYNTTLTLKIEGELDIDLLKSVFCDITKRHESLRTTFGTQNGEPVQYIHDNVDFDIEIIETNGGENELEEIIKDFIKPFNFAKLPLFRIKVVKMTNAQNLYYLVIDIHHIISDGVSGALIINEINALYNGETLPELTVHYKDYAAWHTKLLDSPLMIKEKKFYLKELSGELPVLDLPCDYKRPAIFSGEGESTHYFANAELTEKIRKSARENKVTLFTYLLAAYNVLLSKYTNQDDIIVGSPVSGRIHEDTKNLCGIFLNTLALRNYPKGEKSFCEFVREVGKNCLKAFDNQDYPFNKLVEDLNIPRDTARNPVFSTMFVMQNMGTKDMQSKSFNSSRYDIKHKMAQVDITVNVTETNSGIDFEFNYCSALFKPETIKRMLAHFNNLLNVITKAPETSISNINVLSKEEEKQLTVDFNNTKKEYENVTLHALFEKAAEKNPDSIALFLDDFKMSFGELNKKANKLAHTLINKGVKPEDIVGILTDSSFEMAVAILAVLKSGGAYLPIKTDFPPERINFMLNDTKAKYVLSTCEYKEKIKENAEFLDVENPAIYSENTENPGVTALPENLAYVIYTSGTTGTPKGVLIEHRTISKTLQWRTKIYDFSAKDCSMQLFAYSFDGFLASFFTPLISGASVVLLKKNAEKDPMAVKNQIIKHKVTSFISVPLIFSALVNSMTKDECKSVKSITLAGDKTPVNLVKLCGEKFPWIELVNEYGPTESSVVSSINRNMTADSVTNIGKPCANTEIYILNKENKLLPIGAAGELCISGSRLARGYLNRPQLNEEKFIANPFKAGSRIYKTGDMAKWQPNGDIEFLGRTDFQVKIRGYRIEPAEIETELSKCDAVKECVVIPKENSQNNKFLCAYIVPNRDYTIEELRSFLQNRIPEYEIPSKFVKIDFIPLTVNGKLDCKALPEPDITVAEGAEYSEPETETEKKIAAVWEELLGLKNVGKNHNFFEIGGDSLSIIKLQEKLDSIFPNAVTVTDLFSYPTVSRISGFIDNKSSEKKLITPQKTEANNTDDIAIIGMSLNLPQSKNKEELWKNIISKNNLVCDMPKERIDDAKEILKARRFDVENPAFERLAYIENIDKFDCEFFNITPSEADLMDPNQRLFLECAYHAAEDAGYCKEQLKGSDTGVFVGFGGDSDYGRFLSKVSPQSYSLAAAGNLTSVIASRISYFLDLKGPAVVINTACSSSLAAVHEACASIKRGECETALAGGVKLFLDPLKDEFSMGIEAEGEKTKTFDDSSDGTIKGEGVAAVFLKPLKKAIADNDSIYAVIKGSAVNQDGTSNGITAPNPKAQAEVIEKALINANVNPETIGFIEAHGTGTKLGDPIEIDGITKAFKKFTDKKQFCAISAIKSNLGHLDNAAGITGLIKAALALNNRELPPTANFNNPNRVIDFINSPVYVLTKPKKWEQTKFPRRAAVSAFGLSGTNCHVILEEAPQRVKISTKTDLPNILTLSAKTKEGLIRLANECKAKLTGKVDADYLRNFCFTMNTGRSHYNYRAAVVFENSNAEKDLEKLISLLLTGETCENTYFSMHKVVPKETINNENLITQSKKNELSAKAGEILKNAGELSKKELCSLAELYVKGADFDFSLLYCGENLMRLNAPTYPFEKQRHWTDFRAEIEETSDSRYYSVCWDEKKAAENLKSSPMNTLIVYDEDSKELAELIKSKSGECELVFANKDYKVNLKAALNRAKILEKLSILYLVGFNKKGENTVDELNTRTDSIVDSISTLFAKFDELSDIKADFAFVSSNVNSVTGFESELSPLNAVSMGLAKSAALEHSNVFIRYIDCDFKTSLETVASEILGGNRDVQTAFRNNVRYTDSIRKVELKTVPSRDIGFSEKGVYIITGGTGKLGLEAAKHLALKGKINIALLNRTEKTSFEMSKEIKSSGSNVFTVICDITDEKSISATLNRLREKYKRINGIVHCAAVGVGKFTDFVGKESVSNIKEVLAPKVLGTFLLDKLTREDKPDFFISYSSGITLIGGFSTGAYTAANSYLDSFAQKRDREGLSTLTVDWPVFETASQDKNSDLMFEPVSSKAALTDLDKLLTKRLTRVVVGKMNFNCSLFTVENKFPFNLCSELKSRVKIKPAAKLSTDFDAPQSEEETLTTNLFAKVLGYERVGIFDDFFELGGNSLLAVKFIGMFEKEFNKKLAIKDFYENSTPQKLAVLLESSIEENDEYEEIDL